MALGSRYPRSAIKQGKVVSSYEGIAPDSFPSGQVRLLGIQRHLQHAVALVAEQVEGLLDVVEREAVRDERRQVDAALLHIAISRRIRSLPPGQSVVTIFWSPSPA